MFGMVPDVCIGCQRMQEQGKFVPFLELGEKSVGGTVMLGRAIILILLRTWGSFIFEVVDF
ncbi:MAG: hypothetical protein HY983_04590 [Candidatus Magasanikbacteria bacterium]|nr:hypothetical protein [Candidatus Magasanikbacteria bacterium]